MLVLVRYSSRQVCGEVSGGNKLIEESLEEKGCAKCCSKREDADAGLALTKLSRRRESESESKGGREQLGGCAGCWVLGAGCCWVLRTVQHSTVQEQYNTYNKRQVLILSLPTIHSLFSLCSLLDD